MIRSICFICFAALGVLVLGCTQPAAPPPTADSTLTECLAQVDKSNPVSPPTATDHAPAAASESADDRRARTRTVALHMANLGMCMKRTGFIFNVPDSDADWEAALAAKFPDTEKTIDSADPDFLEIQRQFMRKSQYWKPGATGIETVP
jgi:hypothetical protein